MGDRKTPMLKPDEQHPLLKIDGGGDINHVQPAQTVVTPSWGVTWTKPSRFSRWPEFVSACWMTLILCGISFLVFHALGMGFYRRQQFIIMRCNNSKPASNVFYHHIVQRGSQIPFVTYTEYLSDMATQYPSLNFNLIFLIDDFHADGLRTVKRNIPAYHSWLYNYKLDDIGKQTFNEFKRTYQNVKVTVIPLNKYMAMTPLKFKWRLIPQAHLTFYARVFSVWQNGGIGIDLRTFNNEYHNRLDTNSRIDAILRQHNDGINNAEYTKALNKIDNDEANAVFKMLFGLINNFLSESGFFFNRNLSVPQPSKDEIIFKTTHQSIQQTNSHFKNEVVIGNNNDPKEYYNIDNTLNDTENTNQTIATSDPNSLVAATTTTTTNPEKKSLNSTDLKNSKVTKNSSDPQQVILFYDLSIISDDSSPFMPAVFKQKQLASSKTVPRFLSIDPEGTFIAASSKLHPFLAHLISSGCYGMPPKFAIQNALLTQCSGVFKDDEYCNNIYIL